MSLVIKDKQQIQSQENIVAPDNNPNTDARSHVSGYSLPVALQGGPNTDGSQIQQNPEKFSQIDQKHIYPRTQGRNSQMNNYNDKISIADQAAGGHPHISS